MKAYIGGLYSTEDYGNAVVFAENSKEAKKVFIGHRYGIADYAESYIDIYVRRAPGFDGMERYSDAELMCEQWKQCWRFDYQDMPDCENATDEDFFEWYKKEFGRRYVTGETE